MKRSKRLLLMGVCSLICALGIAHWLHSRPIYAQQSSNYYDDGTFFIYSEIVVDNSYNLDTDSYMEVEYDDYEDIDEIAVEAYADQDNQIVYDAYQYGDDYDPAEVELYSLKPVAPGHEYGIESDGYACYDDGEGDCSFYFVNLAYASVNVVAPLPQITSISPTSANQGSQGTLTITGTNLVVGSNDNLTLNFSGGGLFTPAGSPSASTASFTYNLASATAGTYTLSVTNKQGQSNNLNFTVNGSTPPAGPPTDPCAVSSDPKVQFTAIVPTGTSAGTGSMAISFTGAAFANKLSSTVTYGPYSTPSSIASDIAATVTKNFLQFGLSAKAFGANVVYSGNTALGTASDVVTGRSFSTDTSAGAAADAETACDNAPQTPQPQAETTVVAWIDGSAITLPPGASLNLQLVFPPPPLGPWPVGTTGYAACLAEVLSLTTGQLGAVSNTSADKSYANAWLLKYAGNTDPGYSITPATFTSFSFQYRLFADYAPGRGISTASIGYTPDPCGTPFVYVQGASYSQNGHTGTSQIGYQYLLAETRVGTLGQAGWKTLNNMQEIPWVWSVLEFDQNGHPARYLNSSTVLCGGNATSINYQIFPTYSVYMALPGAMTASFITKIQPGSVSAFANLPAGQSLDQSCIQ